MPVDPKSSPPLRPVPTGRTTPSDALWIWLVTIGAFTLICVGGLVDILLTPRP